MRCHCLSGCVVRGLRGVGHSGLTCLQIVIDWRETDHMEEPRDSGNIVNGWEMPGPHEQYMVLPSSLCPINAFGFRLPYVQSVKVSKRKETSPRIIKERGK